MKVKFKKLSPEAVIPKYGRPGDAGLDLTSIKRIYKNDRWEHSTGLAIEIPEGYMGLIFPRGSICKYDQRLSNSVGVIDAGYRGEIKVVFEDAGFVGAGKAYEEGERIAQLIIMPFPSFEIEETNELSDSERGEGRHGSTGK